MTEDRDAVLKHIVWAKPDGGKLWQAHCRFGDLIQQAMKTEAKITAPAAVRHLYAIQRPGREPETFRVDPNHTAEQIAAYLDAGRLRP